MTNPYLNEILHGLATNNPRSVWNGWNDLIYNNEVWQLESDPQLVDEIYEFMLDYPQIFTEDDLAIMRHLFGLGENIISH